MRQVLFAGGIVGLTISIAVLVLYWFGVAGVLIIGNTNLEYFVWPSSAMLVVGWRTTILGIMITASSVAMNCLLYMVVAYALRQGIRFVRTLLAQSGDFAHQQVSGDRPTSVDPQ